MTDPGDAGAPPPEERAMRVLCYLGLLALVPYLLARGSEVVRFHARQGLALALLGVLCAAVAAIPGAGVFGGLGLAATAALSVVGIARALAGDRWRMPVAATVADRLGL